MVRPVRPVEVDTGFEHGSFVVGKKKNSDFSKLCEITLDS